MEPLSQEDGNQEGGKSSEGTCPELLNQQISRSIRLFCFSQIPQSSLDQQVSSTPHTMHYEPQPGRLYRASQLGAICPHGTFSMSGGMCGFTIRRVGRDPASRRQVLQCTGQYPTTKKYLVQHVNNAKIEKPWAIRCLHILFCMRHKHKQLYHFCLIHPSIQFHTYVQHATNPSNGQSCCLFCHLHCYLDLWDLKLVIIFYDKTLAISTSNPQIL